MKIFRCISPIACVTLLLAAAGTAKAAPIVANGTFSGGLTSWTPSGGGTTPGIGITVLNLGGPGASDQFGDVIPDAPGGTSNGAYFVDDNANEMLQQTVTLAANTSYDLTFDLYQPTSGANNQFNFLLTDSLGDPTVIASSSIGNASLPVAAWTLETLQFTTGSATSYNLDFDFMSGSTPAKDVVLTNVGIDPVPEPSSFILLGSGLLAAAGVVRRRLAV